MLRQFLSEADFEEAFPYIFGHPMDDKAEVAVRNECGLLLRKAQLHLEAVLRANESNNLHSLAVHIRVVLECAAQIVWTANSAGKGSGKELDQVLNVRESDLWYALASLSRGTVEQSEIQKTIASARSGIGQQGSKRPKRVSPTQKIDHLPGGRSWYSHISEYFCRGDSSALTGPSFFGGVTSIDKEADELAFAIFLDNLTGQVARMLVGYGFLLIAVNSDGDPFDDAIELSERRRSAAGSYQRSLREQSQR